MVRPKCASILSAIKGFYNIAIAIITGWQSSPSQRRDGFVRFVVAAQFNIVMQSENEINVECLERSRRQRPIHKARIVGDELTTISVAHFHRQSVSILQPFNVPNVQ